MADFITVEVAYAMPERQSLLTVNVSPDSSVQQIIEQSGILQQFSDIDLNTQKVGVWSRPVKLDDTLTVHLKVLRKEPKGRVVVECDVRNQNEQKVVIGEAKVIAPTEKVSLHKPRLPKIAIEH